MYGLLSHSDGRRPLLCTDAGGSGHRPGATMDTATRRLSGTMEGSQVYGGDEYEYDAAHTTHKGRRGGDTSMLGWERDEDGRLKKKM